MTIRLATQQDILAWNHYAASHPEATPYHQFAWKQSIEQAYGHECPYLIAEAHGSITGVMPLAIIKPPLLPGELCALPFCDLGHYLADNEQTGQALLQYALDMVNREKLRKLEHRASSLNQALSEQQLTGQKVRMLLDLPETSELLSQSFKSKLRSQINKAKKNGLAVRLDREAKSIDAFYEVFSKNMHKLGSPVHSKKWFESIRNNYADNLIISTVWKDEAIAGAGIVLFNGKSASIPWASTIAEFNKLAPNMLLYWSLLEYVTDQGYRQFDFGRSTVGEGTYKFKKQWGAEPVALAWQNYPETTAITDSQPTSPGKLRNTVESLWKKMPLPLTIKLGPRVRKYISL